MSLESIGEIKQKPILGVAQSGNIGALIQVSISDGTGQFVSHSVTDSHRGAVAVISFDHGCLGNFVSGNCIFSNGGWGIVIGANPGLNTSNLAVLASAFSDGVITGLTGSLSANANGQFLIQFYENLAPNPSGYGEGLTNIGSANITTAANGKASFSLTLPLAIPLGRYLSATVTDAANTTWEFSHDVTVVPPPSFTFIQSGAQITLVTNPVTHQVTTNRVPITITALWPTNPAGYVLQSANNLTPTVSWSAATNAISTNGLDSSTGFVPNGLISFYRLVFH